MIFNKDGNGAQELKDRIGFIYKSNSFENLITYLDLGKSNIIQVIGKGVYDCAEAHYLSDNYNVVTVAPVGDEPDAHPEYKILDELVRKIQVPLALYAYTQYAPNNDLSHSESGRHMIVTADEKSAFEWMINKSDKSLLNLVHRFTDLLIDFLDANIDEKVTVEGKESNLIPWRDSDAIKEIRSLFIKSSREFDREFSIDGSRRVFIAVIPFMRRIQENILRPILGEDRYQALITGITSGDLNADNKELLSLIQPALAMLTMSNACLGLHAQVLPDGVFSNYVTLTIDSKNSTLKADRIELSANLKKMGDEALGKLKERLIKLKAVASGNVYTPRDKFSGIKKNEKFIRL